MLKCLGAQIAAISLFQVDVDEPQRSCIWYCYKKKNSAPVASLMTGQGRQCPRHAPALRRPCTSVWQHLTTVHNDVCFENHKHSVCTYWSRTHVNKATLTWWAVSAENHSENLEALFSPENVAEALKNAVAFWRTFIETLK